MCGIEILLLNLGHIKASVEIYTDQCIKEKTISRTLEWSKKTTRESSLKGRGELVAGVFCRKVGQVFK